MLKTSSLLLATTLIISPLALPSQALAQTTVAPNEQQMLQTALDSGDKQRFLSTLDIILTSFPEKRQEISDYAKNLYPSIADEIETFIGNLAVYQDNTSDAPKNNFQIGSVVSDHADFLDFEKWKGSAELGFSTSSGDTDAQALAAGFEVTRDFNSAWEHSLNIDLDFARANGTQNKERAVGDYQVFYRNWDRGYAFGKVRGEYDKFSGFDYRFTESIGLGYTVFDKPDLKWSVEGGPGLRQNKLDNGPTESDVVGTLNSNVRYWFKPDMNIGNDTESTFGSNRITVNTTTDFRTKFSSALTARFSLELSYDSKVPLGTSKLDTITRASIIYDF